jgi:Uma2 family endonuclease
MPGPAIITTDLYFRMPETRLPQELVYGVVRDAPGPAPGHQWVVGQLFIALRGHLDRYALGRAWFSPIDVVLDAEHHLVVQPDLIVVTNARLPFVRDRVWGPPDLVIEVLSPRPRIGSLEERIEWFARYGVRECWLVHRAVPRLEVLVFDAGTIAERRLVGADEPVRSAVLPQFTSTLQAVLDR